MFAHQQRVFLLSNQFGGPSHLLLPRTCVDGARDEPCDVLVRICIVVRRFVRVGKSRARWNSSRGDVDATRRLDCNARRHVETCACLWTSDGGRRRKQRPCDGRGRRSRPAARSYVQRCDGDGRTLVARRDGVADGWKRHDHVADGNAPRALQTRWTRSSCKMHNAGKPRSAPPRRRKWKGVAVCNSIRWAGRPRDVATQVHVPSSRTRNATNRRMKSTAACRSSSTSCPAHSKKTIQTVLRRRWNPS